MIRFLKRVLFWLPFGCLIFSSCERCGPDQRIGEIQLSTRSKLFVPIESDDQLNFHSDEREVWVFDFKEDIEETLTTGHYLTCNVENRFFQRAYYTYQGRRVSYSSDRLSFSYTLKIVDPSFGFGSDSDVPLMDVFQLKELSDPKNLSIMTIITWHRGNEFEIENIQSGGYSDDSYHEDYVFNGDTVIAGTDIVNAYISKEVNNNQFIISLGEGVVGIINNGDVWLLQ
ncbi:MAG: hypothetical protein AAF391_01280 [Bacteroidota bacterium]